MNKKLILALILAGGLVSVQPAAAAAKIQSLYTTGSAISILLLLCAIICLIWALKILSLVRGGLMSRSWQMFVVGFCFLIFAQLLTIGQEARIFSLPGYMVTALYLVMAFTWLMGLYQTRKVLG